MFLLSYYPVFFLGFLDSRGYSVEEFYKACREAMEDMYTPLFEVCIMVQVPRLFAHNSNRRMRHHFPTAFAHVFIFSPHFHGSFTSITDTVGAQEHEHHWFVELLLASIDYSRFHGLMLNEARKQLRTRRK